MLFVVRGQASRAGFSTKHVVIDSREPEIKKPATSWQCEGVAMSALRLKIPWLGFWWAVKDSNLSTLPL